MKSSCLICERTAEIVRGANRHFVAEMETGYVVLADFQFFRGYTLFLCKDHVGEIHLLPPPKKERFLIEMSLVAEAVFHCFQPAKLNYECLGNAEPHLHWHIIPRYADDPSPGTTSWKVDKALRYNEKFRPTDVEIASLRTALLQQLTLTPGVAIRRS